MKAATFVTIYSVRCTNTPIHSTVPFCPVHVYVILRNVRRVSCKYFVVINSWTASEHLYAYELLDKSGLERRENSV